MTAHASPYRLIGHALPENSQFISEIEKSRVLVMGERSNRFIALCDALDVEIIHVRSHHELPFRLHHNRPLAVLAALPPDTLVMSSTLRCIAAYDADLPVLLLGDDHAALLGTMDAAEQLWGLSHLAVEPCEASHHGLIAFFAKAGQQRGALRLMAVG